MKDITKLSKIKEAMENNNWDIALKIAGSFNRLGEHEEVIKRAADSLLNPNFYKQMGYDLDLIKEEGVRALKARYSKTWNQVKQKK